MRRQAARKPKAERADTPRADDEGARSGRGPPISPPSAAAAQPSSLAPGRALNPRTMRKRGIVGGELLTAQQAGLGPHGKALKHQIPVAVARLGRRRTRRLRRIRGLAARAAADRQGILDRGLPLLCGFRLGPFAQLPKCSGLPRSRQQQPRMSQPCAGFSAPRLRRACGAARDEVVAGAAGLGARFVHPGRQAASKNRQQRAYPARAAQQAYRIARGDRHGRRAP